MTADTHPQATVRTNGAALASLILGLVSLIADLLLIPSVLGIIFGILGLRRAPSEGRRGLAVGGIVLSVVGAVVALSVTGLLIASVVGSAASADDGDSAVVNPSPARSEAPAEEPSVDTAPVFAYEDAGITAELKTTEKQCFGSAGCNVSVEVELAVDDAESIPSDASGSITYTISGDESGPVIGTIDITGTSYSVPEENLSTASNGTDVTIEITDIETN